MAIKQGGFRVFALFDQAAIPKTLDRKTAIIAITARSGTYLTVLVILGTGHLMNDLLQSLIPAIYPILNVNYALDFVPIGMITLTFQIAGALLQPVIGMVTDRHPAPYSPVVGMMFTLSGLVSLAYAHSYAVILVSMRLIGIGSAIFHPAATRMARYAAGGRQGVAQGFFQVGGQTGGSLGPVFAAFIIVPWGQPSLVWFAAIARLAMPLLTWIGSKQKQLRGMPPLKWSTNWDMTISFLGGLNDGRKTREA